MKITALFTESRPHANFLHAKISGTRVEVISKDEYGTYNIVDDSGTFIAYSNELTEPSCPLGLIDAKQRVLGK